MFLLVGRLLEFVPILAIGALKPVLDANPGVGSESGFGVLSTTGSVSKSISESTSIGPSCSMVVGERDPVSFKEQSSIDGLE